MSLQQPPQIGILHYAGPPGIGGVEATMAAHARLLSDDGWQVRLVVGSGTAPDPRVELRHLPLMGSRHPLIEAINGELQAGLVSPQFYDLVATLEDQLATALAACDVVIMHNVQTLHKNLALTAALAQLHQAGRLPRLIAWAHDFAWLDPLYVPQMYEGWPWSLLRTAWSGVHYVAVSQDRRLQLAELLHIAPHEITVVPPGVDVARLLKLELTTTALVEEYNMLQADPLLILPARITRRKNIELALRIVAELQATGWAPLLVVTGPPGPHNPSNAAYLAELQALRNETEVPVVFLYEALRDPQGTPLAVNDAMIADWFSLADGLLFPSRSEGFGMPLIEAALCGVPIFCSAIEPFAEIVGHHALRFGLEEPPATIARRIADMLRIDPRYALRRRARLHYTWQAIYNQVMKPLLHHNE